VVVVVTDVELVVVAVVVVVVVVLVIAKKTLFRMPGALPIQKKLKPLSTPFIELRTATGPPWSKRYIARKPQSVEFRIDTLIVGRYREKDPGSSVAEKVTAMHSKRPRGPEANGILATMLDKSRLKTITETVSGSSSPSCAERRLDVTTSNLYINGPSG